MTQSIHDSDAADFHLVQSEISFFHYHKNTKKESPIKRVFWIESGIS